MLDLERTIALNKWWQEQYDKKHPKEALRRKRRDAKAFGELEMAKKSPSRRFRRPTS